jgi:hypothetical protein
VADTFRALCGLGRIGPSFLPSLGTFIELSKMIDRKPFNLQPPMAEPKAPVQSVRYCRKFLPPLDKGDVG